MMYIGVRFMMKHGQFINVRVHPDKAYKILSRWLSDRTDYTFSNLEDNDGSGTYWVVRAQDCQCVHTFDWREPEPQNVPQALVPQTPFPPQQAQPTWTAPQTPPPAQPTPPWNPTQHPGWRSN